MQFLNMMVLVPRFPVTAFVSILHRISGLLLFVGMVPVLGLLATAVESPEGFSWVRGLLFQPLMRPCSWVLLLALVYHWWAGVRHLLMDLGWFESMTGGRVTAWLALVLSIGCSVLLALYLGL